MERITELRIKKAISAINAVLVWEYESLPDGALEGTGLTLEATLAAALDALNALVGAKAGAK